MNKDKKQNEKEDKEKQNIKCTCTDPFCYKCIGISCQDDSCSTHPLLAKILARESKK